MSQILITGGTGLLGSALTKMLLGNGHKVIILSRTKRTSNDSNITYALWDVKDQTIDESAVSAADYVFHLAGAT
jgi:nucleoside-diphosphate-sugar epimerase